MFSHRKFSACLYLGTLIVGAFAARQAHAVAFSVGNDANCTHTSLQDAIDDLPDNVPGNTIQVAYSAAYGQAAFTIDNKSVTLDGGYQHCGDTSYGPNQAGAILDGTSNGGHSVLHISGASNVTLQHLVLQNGVQGNDSHGGGINFDGHGSLAMTYVSINNNRCGYGAGINVSPDGATAVTLGYHVFVENNNATHEGGGIRIEGNTVLNISGLATQIEYNVAGEYGGGLHVIGPARADISSAGNTTGSSPTSVWALFLGNMAGSGGAISAVTDSSGDDALVRLFTADSGGRPPRLLSNRAIQTSGGAVYLRSSSGAHARLCANDFSIENNAAPDGSAIMADENGSNGSMVYLNQFGDPDHVCLAPGPMSGAVRCVAGASCNDISGNLSVNNLGQATGGATVWVREDGKLLADKLRITGNTAGSALRISTNAGSLADADVHSCLIVGNHVSDAVVRSEGNSPVHIRNCTITDNIIGAPTALLLDDDYVIQRSIIWQPSVTTIQETDSGSSETTTDVFKSDIFGCNPTSGCTVPPSGDSPRFVDPAHGDYHLQTSSQAVDYSATADGVDLDGLPRGVDLTGVPNFHGASDLGAFERQSYVLVLNGDFDQDLNLWTNVASGNYSAAFDATKDHSSASTSGSVDLQYTSSGGGTGTGPDAASAGDVPILTQCFGLPNYGTYQLTGYDYRFGSALLMNTVVSLEWNEYDTSFNCSGAPDRQGQLFLPYSNPIAWRTPSSPALIASGQVGHAFAHNASVSVTLTFYQPTATSSTTATVDGISLVPYNSDEIFANGFEP